jgi:homoserine trans-succinylase
MLPDIAPKLAQKLKALNYWDTFTETGFSPTYKTHYSVIWLHSLNQLWTKHTAQSKRFGLAEIGDAAMFVVQSDLEYEDVKKAHNPKEPHLGEFARMSNEQFRVFMAGLVIDLIRLASVAAEDVEFWQELSDLLGPKK